MATGPTGLTVAFEHVVCPFFDGWVQRDTVGACSTRRPHSLHPSHRAQRDCKVRRDILWAPNQDLPLNPLLHDLLPHGLPLLLPLPPPAARVAAPSTVGSTWRQTTLPPLSWRSPSLGPCARTLTSLHCSPELIVIVSLMKIFYPGTYAEHEKLLGHLEQAAAHADCQLPIGNEAVVKCRQNVGQVAPVLHAIRVDDTRVPETAAFGWKLHSRQSVQVFIITG
mmetsp:Transcript_24579/g.79373  ORF Transcript_24579/g.79373 Transcript_24579/m.79373 type:complete len:223 (+) Transcript_24579:151-819(+)